jgi:hypothetical protein
VDEPHPTDTLDRVLRFLGHAPPAAVRGKTLDDLWAWAIQNWRRENLPRARSIIAPDA